MALPMLVGGADCGPVNPLQGLTKTFDQDRGTQQDQFGGRAGPSKQAFRTQQLPSRQLDNDAAKFFSNAPTAAPSAFDLSGLHASLPAPSHDARLSFQPSQQQPHVPSAAWAMDFMQHQQQQTGPPMTFTAPLESQSSRLQSSQHGNTMFWSPPSFGPMQHAYNHSPMISTGGEPVHVQKMNVVHDPSLWEQDFLQEAVSTAMDQDTALERAAQRSPQADSLSRTAGLLVDTLRDEQNPKFKNSEFMGLMRSLRDKTLVVQGNEIVAGDEVVSGGGSVDIKGKGRATDIPELSARERYMDLNGLPLASDHDRAGLIQTFNQVLDQAKIGQSRAGQSAEERDDVYEYFRQENEEYIAYQQEQLNKPQLPIGILDDNTAQWAKLQSDWDAFEATASGIKPVSTYQFTPNNPYMLGERSGITKTHASHSYEASESVLELEAAVQRDPQNAQAWFALGVKQQDNEREPKAIEALRRAVALDPNYMPSWLALGISHTNESDRAGAYDAIRQWVERHDRYNSISLKLSDPPASPTAVSSQMERYDELISCLISMARSDVGGDIDADIQVALAVLLNSNEEYAKATDCFMTALAVRPDDWVLYNRVGATLANNGTAEEALQYYYRALELNPMYIRARFNLGISCINLHRYEEAGRHILDALTLQESDTVGRDQADGRGGVASAALWNCLRTACVHMDNMDMAAMCETQDLEGLRRHFHS